MAQSDANSNHSGLGTFDSLNGFSVNGTTVINSSGKVIESAGIELSNGDSFLDNNGNEVLKFGVVPSAVNEITITNAAASSEPEISATGSDTDIDIKLTPKGAGTVTVGVDGTGYDVKFFGDTASNSWLWDQSADKVVQTFTSASTSTVEPYTLTSTLSGVGVTGGRLKHALTISAAAGSYTNALKGDVTYGASGRTDGLGSSVLAEMTLSAGTTQGTYAPLEVELNLGSNSPIGTNTSFGYFSANGTATNFIDSGYVLNLQGLGAATSGKIFQANTAIAATHALRILIGATPYYIMLTDTGA